MSSTLLEVTRAAHEEVERLERLIVKELQNEPSSNKDRLFQSHRVHHMIDSITVTTGKLVEIYEDTDNARKDEIAALGGQTATGTNVFSAFYDRLKEIREYHRRHPAARVVDANEEYEALLKEEPVIEFSGEALAALGLKTGGTVQQRAERLFLTKDTPLEMLDKKHFAKGSRGPEQNGVAAAPEVNNLKEIALIEAEISKLCELLEETIERTKENIVKKQALTYEEILEDIREVDIQPDTESDDDDQQIYNPLKLPMGWDGKPIPYWLYKLHGLGQEFKCEICGNYSYWGRRAFERHFKEWRHQHGMRCLGIPNTKNFNEITSIEEAKELWKRIQERQGLNKWRPDLEEEYEDKEGNIYNKKTYTDLQRQGLI
ncbi:Splicing factor 3A subunit [Trema orientale]|uniref:Splicing factor 3A subunit n=1 Tax=Trema orientale TaxID=63057 RepID=A0A2P5FGB8_TREOI|nr:Splicing factor 3A subunit [Trema orientale]